MTSLIPRLSEVSRRGGEPGIHFKLDPMHSSGSGFHRTLSHHVRMDDIISCQVSIKSYCSSFLMAMASSRFEEAQSYALVQLGMLQLAVTKGGTEAGNSRFLYRQRCFCVVAY